ncbi:hypothetical protein N7495_000410 [Penicillium taxi]|uniref:uncharacterized protein n=1 Tax=Penicillium taxi TaxID=168475 RepID=UPI002544D5B0|nr:uncharacterized protein N7495_000410 [Penicillium taxi]KAJ5907728.1 hypothetical protein N7495_000410 [Penicillium taxi]
MFSNIVTAAKGLFTREESQENLENSAGSNMATARHEAAEQAPDVPKTNDTANQGKRKAQPAKAEKISTQKSKRQKKNSIEAADDEDKPASNSKLIRFGSEEPAVPTTQPEVTPAVIVDSDDSEDDSDDDAPEMINNASELLKMKEQAKKQENIKKLEEQLMKEKRRKLDERRKLQAKSTKKDVPVISDDLLSVSTATLQGSSTQETRRRALPALLPDDILNAEPAARPLTPPVDDPFATSKKSTKLLFLEKSDKAPKDVQVGDVTIRVLDASSKKQNSKPVLAPKASKSGKNVKDTWLKGQRSTGHVNGLRRTAGGTSGFVRR